MHPYSGTTVFYNVQRIEFSWFDIQYEFEM